MAKVKNVTRVVVIQLNQDEIDYITDALGKGCYGDGSLYHLFNCLSQSEEQQYEEYEEY